MILSTREICLVSKVITPHLFLKWVIQYPPLTTRVSLSIVDGLSSCKSTDKSKDSVAVEDPVVSSPVIFPVPAGVEDIISNILSCQAEWCSHYRVIQGSVSCEEPRVRTVAVPVVVPAPSSEISTLGSCGDEGEEAEGGQDGEVHTGRFGVREVSIENRCQTWNLYSALLSDSESLQTRLSDYESLQ